MVESKRRWHLNVNEYTFQNTDKFRNIGMADNIEDNGDTTKVKFSKYKVACVQQAATE